MFESEFNGSLSLVNIHTYNTKEHVKTKYKKVHCHSYIELYETFNIKFTIALLITYNLHIFIKKETN